MNKNNPHKPLRSSWRSEVFTKAKTGKVIITNRSIGRNNSGSVRRMQGVSMSAAGLAGGYLY